MITKIRIHNYRIFQNQMITPRPGINLLVGDNEAGKSTLLEAIQLCLTGRLNGRPAKEELHPFWFNRTAVEALLASTERTREDLPVIRIEVFFSVTPDLAKMRGVNNTLREDCPGVTLLVRPDPEFSEELDECLQGELKVLPIDFYDVEWRTFADTPLTSRPKNLAVSFIDSRTVRSSSGIDFHMREILSDHLTPKERAQVSLAYRTSRHDVSEEHLQTVNDRIASQHQDLHDKVLGLALDQTAHSSWESGVSPHIDSVPFALSGQGQQASVKIALAMNRSGQRATNFVLVEEPENHLSFTNLRVLIERMKGLCNKHLQQVFITTHSSFVLNRLGLDALTLLHQGTPASFGQLSPATVRYFQRLPGFDTLRLIVASKLVLVEGPSDEIIFERALKDVTGRTAAEQGIDIVSMRGVAPRRGLEVAHALDRRLAVLRDNDGKDPSHWIEPLAELLLAGRRQMFIGDPADGNTLEPQIESVNSDSALRALLGYDGELTTKDWMEGNKTEAAIRIAESENSIVYPEYILEAIEFIK